MFFMKKNQHDLFVLCFTEAKQLLVLSLTLFEG